MKTRKNTMTDLVIELEKMSDTEIKKRLIGLAKKGKFHDYRSDEVCGKMYFTQYYRWAVQFLENEDIMLLDRMRLDIVNGVYDEELTDEDRIFLKNKMESDNSLSDTDRNFFYAAMGIK